MLERREEAVTRDVGRMSRAPEPARVTPEEEAVPPRSRGQAPAGGNCGTHCRQARVAQARATSVLSEERGIVYLGRSSEGWR